MLWQAKEGGKGSILPAPQLQVLSTLIHGIGYHDDDNDDNDTVIKCGVEDVGSEGMKKLSECNIFSIKKGHGQATQKTPTTRSSFSSIRLYIFNTS